MLLLDQGCIILLLFVFKFENVCDLLKILPNLVSFLSQEISCGLLLGYVIEVGVLEGFDVGLDSILHTIKRSMLFFDSALV